MRPEVLIRLETLKNDLVRAAEELCERTIPEGLTRRQDGVTRAMLHNLLNAANATNSVAEVTNFVRYQVGRSSEEERWRRGDFGEGLLRAIQRASALAGSDAELAIEAVRHLCGYVLREATYRSVRRDERGERRARQA